MDNLTFNEYPFLKELGLSTDNKGCYSNGKWSGSGQTITSVNPANNKPIARVTMASLAEYHETVKHMEAEKDKWAKTPGPVRGEILR